MGIKEEIKRPSCMLSSSDLAMERITLNSLGSWLPVRLDRYQVVKYRSTAAKPMIAVMLKMFEPRTLPTESAAPPDKAAIIATVNSGRVVDIAMRVKPTEVLPRRVMAATFMALFMVMLLA
jgi:hypothetical protein